MVNKLQNQSTLHARVVKNPMLRNYDIDAHKRLSRL